MSTAGKVLVVLILLSTLVWVLLTAGVDQLNRNGNQAVAVLTEKVAKLQDDVKKTQAGDRPGQGPDPCVSRTMDRELAVHQLPCRMMSSGWHRMLPRLSPVVRYELATVQQTVSSAVQDRTQRTAEVAADQKALDAAKDEFESLKATDGSVEKSPGEACAKSSRRLST